MKTLKINEKMRKNQGAVYYEITHVSISYCPRVFNLIQK